MDRFQLPGDLGPQAHAVAEQAEYETDLRDHSDRQREANQSAFIKRIDTKLDELKAILPAMFAAGMFDEHGQTVETIAYIQASLASLEDA